MLKVYNYMTIGLILFAPMKWDKLSCYTNGLFGSPLKWLVNKSKLEYLKCPQFSV